MQPAMNKHIELPALVGVQPPRLPPYDAGSLSVPQLIFKRLLDLLLGSLLLLVSFPFLVLIAVAVRLDSRGPVILRQLRIGGNGRPFVMFKFRSMLDGAESQQALLNERLANGLLIHKHPGDPRITRTGRFLRRWSLDELPQLWNVLRGEMSLVGPRPELPWIVQEYEPEQFRRFAVPCGLTGWWQIHARSERPMHLCVAEDLYYIDHYSLQLDLWILLRTPLAILRGRGAF